MALTDKEKAFYDSLKKFLEEQGITKDKPYRAVELLVIDDFTNRRGYVDKNVVSMAFLEKGETRIVKNVPRNYLEWGDIYEYIYNPSALEELKPEKQEKNRKLLMESRTWLKNNLKNIDTISEEQIKYLYNRFMAGCLVLDEAATKNFDISNLPNNFSYLYAGADGSIKMTPPSHEIAEKYPFNIRNLNNAFEFSRELASCAAAKEYVINKYGEKLWNATKIYKKGEPERPGVFTIILSWIHIPSAVSKVTEHRRYVDASNYIDEKLKDICKEIYPEVQNPQDIIRSYDQDYIGENAAAGSVFRRLAISELTAAEMADNEERVQYISGDRPEYEKDMLRYALESRYDASLSRNLKNFLEDMPKVIDDVVYLDITPDFTSDKLHEIMFESLDSEKMQNKLSKLAIYKMIYEDLKAGKQDSSIIKAIDSGLGDKVVEAFRTSGSGQETFGKFDVVKAITSGDAKAVYEKYPDFTKNIERYLNDNSLNYNKKVAEQTISDNLNAKRRDSFNRAEKRERKEAELKEQRRIEKERAEIRREISNPKKTSLTVDDVDRLLAIARDEYKEKPNAQNFINWKINSAAKKYLESHDFTNVTKNSMKANLKALTDRIEKMPEFKDALDRGSYDSLDRADYDLGLFDNKRKASEKQAPVVNEEKPDAIKEPQLLK